MRHNITGPRVLVAHRMAHFCLFFGGDRLQSRLRVPARAKAGAADFGRESRPVSSAIGWGKGAVLHGKDLGLRGWLRVGCSSCSRTDPLLRGYDKNGARLGGGQRDGQVARQESHSAGAESLSRPCSSLARLSQKDHWDD
jgi:hypothetical protein